MALDDEAVRQQRRQEHAAAVIRETGLDEPTIRSVVENFYARARQDELLGPVFNETVEDWDHHIAVITDFWSSVVLMTGRYSGHPMRKHLPLPIGKAHFQRWLALFGQTARELCRPEGAAYLMERAERIGQSLLYGVSVHRGEYPAGAPS